MNVCIITTAVKEKILLFFLDFEITVSDKTANLKEYLFVAAASRNRCYFLAIIVEPCTAAEVKTISFQK